jgi:hypothetical protein
MGGKKYCHLSGDNVLVSDCSVYSSSSCPVGCDVSFFDVYPGSFVSFEESAVDCNSSVPGNQPCCDALDNDCDGMIDEGGIGDCF